MLGQMETGLGPEDVRLAQCSGAGDVTTVHILTR